MNTITTLDHSPRPNHSMTSGRNTRRGVALKAVMNGSNIALSVRERPSRMPSGSAMTIAMPSPSAKPVALTASGAQIDPLANMVHSVPTTWLGVAKNSLVPADSVKMRGNASHATTSTTMPPAPRIVASWRRQGPFVRVVASPGVAAISRLSAPILLIVLLPDPPGERRALGPADAFGHRDRDGHDHQDAAEHAIEGEQVAEPRDRVADALGRREELSDQHADQRTPDSDARARDDVGQHARKDDLEIQILLGAAERTDDIDEEAIDCARARIGVEDEREDREREDDDGLRRQ